MIKFAQGAHGDSSPFDGPGRVLAHGFYPPPNNGLLAGDIHFDEGETWNKLFLQAVALHEIGHSLGFQHSTDTGAVMYPFFVAGRVTLQTDDLAGLRRLYP
jgi:predicted Zn-dependent protease